MFPQTSLLNDQIKKMLNLEIITGTYSNGNSLWEEAGVLPWRPPGVQNFWIISKHYYQLRHELSQPQCATINISAGNLDFCCDHQKHNSAACRIIFIRLIHPIYTCIQFQCPIIDDESVLRICLTSNKNITVKD